jgi:hypothetical protein
MYSSGLLAQQCTHCTPGTFATSISMRSCYRCKGGTYHWQSNLRAPQCTLCALGTYVTGVANTVCVACRSGIAKPYKYTFNICLGSTYQPSSTASACLTCVRVAGTYSTPSPRARPPLPAPRTPPQTAPTQWAAQPSSAATASAATAW